MIRYAWTYLFLLLIPACAPDGRQTEPSESPQSTSSIRLEVLSASRTGVEFNNTLEDKGNLNVFIWNFLYTGSGVATGDINQDGLPDIYFGGNQVPDRLYLNRGDFHFEDISAAAGIGDGTWTTGVTMADVNGDGLLDIYVCKTSPTLIRANNRNRLYINKGAGQFEERAAEFGLADEGFSIQATFFDADQDGDVDMYLVNQPMDQLAQLINAPDEVKEYPVTDRFFRNEDGRFVDRTSEMHLEEDRYGLGISLGDYDGNGWTDIYLCNDYTQADVLYMNAEGAFTDEIRKRTGHISYYSMGSDAGDINADGWEDVFVLDMAFEDYVRSKTNMKSMQPELFWSIVEEGHQYPYAQNTLQLNRGEGYFSEVAQMGGIAKTDWSWATLLTDLDYDGRQDILVTNGILRDMKNNDFSEWVRKTYQGRVGPTNYLEVLTHLPSNPVGNKVYRNVGALDFEDVSESSGFGTPGFSHGMAYADFDGDGDIDIVTNNMNAPASLYRNASSGKGHYLSISLKGPGTNTEGLGVPVQMFAGGRTLSGTIQSTRGYYSSSVAQLFFGIGETVTIDSVLIYWNAKAMSVVRNLSADQHLMVDFNTIQKIPFRSARKGNVHQTTGSPVDFTHQEKIFDDYAEQVLLPYKLSQNGPYLSAADVDADGITDLFVSGAAGQSGAILLGSRDGHFTQGQTFQADAEYEDQGSAFFDIDLDGDMDLYVASGSNEFPEGSPLLEDRVYLNDGKGSFSRSAGALSGGMRINGQVVTTLDADGDGDQDVFVGGRLVAGRYPEAPESALLINEGGILRRQAEFLDGDVRFGLVTGAARADIDLDGDDDLMVVGEWMAPTVLRNQGDGSFTKEVLERPGAGIWWTIEACDLDGDGDMDFALGNMGWNNKFGGRHPKLEVYASDFDQNGDHDVVLAKHVGDKELPYRGRECSSEEMPFILQKFPSYDAYAHAELGDILGAGLKDAVHLQVQSISSLCLINNREEGFDVVELPFEMQTGPIRNFTPYDLNRDGHMDLICTGNHFPAEVETARYDALIQGICFGDGQGHFTVAAFMDERYPWMGDYRDGVLLETEGKVLFVVAQNAGQVMQYDISR